MATRLKPSRINVDNTPRVGDGAAYQNDNDFHWSMGGGDMSYEDFEWHTLTGTSLVIEDISNNITPSSNFTVSAGTVKPGIEYVLRVNTGNTAYTMTLGTGVTNPNGYNTELEPNTVNQFKFIATSATQLELEGVDSAVISEINWGEIGGTLSNQTDLQGALDEKQDNWIEVNVATANGTAAKVGTTTAGNYTPTKGDFLLVNFVNGCNADNPTLNIDGSGAKNIRTGNINANKTTFVLGSTANSNIKALLYYDGTYYRCWSTTNTNTTYSVMSVSEGQTATATNSRAMRSDYLKQIIKYHAVSDTAYDSTWDGKTDIAPSKNAVYDKIESLNADDISDTSTTNKFVTQTDKDTWDGKQDELQSGTNIKTVNSNSLLGSGNLILNDVKVSAAAPSSPTEGMVWYDTTNDQLKIYDGTNWNVVGDDTADINTKTFVLSNDSDKATATEAYKWYSEGNYPIIIRGNSTFVGPRLSGNNLVFTQTEPNYNTGNTTTLIQPRTITFTYDTSTEQVTQILYSIGGGISVLETNKNYSTPYTPAYSGSPATKKYVDDSVSGAVSKGTTAPSSPVEGQLWYDTTNDVLKTYNGTNWNVTGKEYNAGPGIEIGTYNDYSAMQGPAPDGFHVPSKDEWGDIKNIWTTLGGGSYDGINFSIALKLPLNGRRKYDTANVEELGSQGNYWSYTPNGTNSAYFIYFNSSVINYRTYSVRSNGFAIRCFKDSPVMPTSSWTKLYGTSIETGGIFWNSTDGLISLSSNGQTWKTIADKNLGATSVWNSGDTETDANCGYFYQWGNNYGFSHSGTVTTSSTQVDASNYGPGNYYNNGIFIIRTANQGDWSSVSNDNLWGATIGVITTNNIITNTGVLSVNGQTGDVTIESGGLQVSPNSTITGIKYIWYGTESDYANLSQYYTDTPGDTEFHTF